MFSSRIFYILLAIIAIFTSSIYSQNNQIKTGRIEFNGNVFYSDNELAGFMITKSGSIYSENQLELDLQNIIKNYSLSGYLDTQIKNVNKLFDDDSAIVDLNITINEKSRITVGKIEFTGNKLFSTSALLELLSIRKGDPLDQIILNSDIQKLLDLYESKGYSFVQIRISDIQQYEENNNKKLLILISVEENDLIKIDKVEIEGNTNTKDYVILRELRLKKNNKIDKDDLLKFRQRLENTGYFSSVDLPKIYKYQDRTVLKLYLTEGNTNSFDGIIGYNPPNDNEENGYFTGLINLSLKNLFGTGRTLEARWDKQLKSSQELEIRYIEPWFLNLPLNISAGFTQRIQDSSYIKQNFTGKFEIILNEYFSASLIGQVERVIPSEEFQNQGIASGLLIFDSRQLNGGIEIKFDTRDNIYNPTRGIMYRTSYTLGQKKIYNYAKFNDTLVKPQINVHNLRVDIDFYHSFLKRQSSLISLHGVNITAPVIESADMFRLGGIKNVRGYREGQFPSSKAAWANLELRYALTRKTFASIFYDPAFYYRPFDPLTKNPEQKEFIFGYGLSIRIETGLGIFGVSYALGKGDGPLEGKVHFGLINDF